MIRENPYSGIFCAMKILHSSLVILNNFWADTEWFGNYFWNSQRISCGLVNLLLINVQDVAGGQKQSPWWCSAVWCVKINDVLIKLHRVHKKAYVMEAFFHKTLSSYVCNCTEKDTIFLWIYSWLYFSLFNRDLNESCLVCMFSLRFSGSKSLINLPWQFRVHKIFSCMKIFLTQVFAGFPVISFCV